MSEKALWFADIVMKVSLILSFRLSESILSLKRWKRRERKWNCKSGIQVDKRDSDLSSLHFTEVPKESFWCSMWQMFLLLRMFLFGSKRSRKLLLRMLNWFSLETKVIWWRVEVERIEAQQFAFQNDCLYFETSAKSAKNVEFLFQEMTRLIFKRRGENVLNSEKKEIIIPIKPISSKKIVSCNFCSILWYPIRNFGSFK